MAGHRYAATPMSLCRSCAFVRLVEGRRGQTYLLCRNEAVAVKYPPQPVGRCAGYAAAPPDEPSADEPPLDVVPSGAAPPGIVTPEAR